MPDRLTGLEVFAKVAAAGSLSAAGRAIGLSQTMVTKHLAALETRLGAKLFHRTTRRLSLTDAGRSYLESCERILAEIAAAEAAIARYRQIYAEVRADLESGQAAAQGLEAARPDPLR